MIGIKTILIPVDFSEPSKAAIRYGVSLALQFTSRLVLAHIVPSSTAPIYTYPTQSEADQRAEADRCLEALPALIPESIRERMNARHIVRIGDVATELLAAVRDENADMVVMGTHGRGAFERFVLGSVTEKVLRKFPVPVLTVRSADNPTLSSANPLPFHHVLYATDLSEHSAVGLKFAAELARGAGAHLTVLHVFKPIDAVYWGAEGGYMAGAIGQLRSDLLDVLQQSVPRDWSSNLDVTTKMIDGQPAQEIVHFAEASAADLIVLNLQGKTLVQRALLGSTAERVIRTSHVPVLSIPLPGEYAGKILAELRTSVA